MENELPHRARAVAHPTRARRAFARIMAAVGGALGRWWRGYRSEAILMAQSDAMLRDMGLSRAEIERRIGGRPYY